MEVWANQQSFYPLLSVFWFQTSCILVTLSTWDGFYPLLSVFWFQTT